MKSGTILGAIFGLVVAFQVGTGTADPYSATMFAQSPIITLLLCILKGTVAGLISGLLYKVLSRKGKDKLATICAAISCPIVNTGIFAVGLFVFYNGLINTWAIEKAFANAFTFVMIFMIGLNFVVEFTVNVLLIPVALRMIKIVKRLI